MTEDEKIRLDYERTAQYFFHLADVRFKLLALLPVVSGAALAIIPAHFEPLEMLALGVLGFVVTMGVLLYDQRNSQIYNSLIGRLNLIEESLRLPAMRENKQVGGAFIDRPGRDRRRMLLGILPANHGLGLDLIYSASVAAWLFVITRATVLLLGMGSQPKAVLLLLLPAALGVVLFLNLRRIDGRSDWEGALPSEIRKRIESNSVMKGGSNTMYASIREYKTEPGEAIELARRVKQGFVPIISQAPGFIAYYVVDTGHDVVASISIFQDQAGAEESNRMAADWVKANIATLVSGPSEITAGTVTVHSSG